jgi:hypothetical protein
MRNNLDNQIEQIVAKSDGSMLDALRALMQVNEKLEAELAQLRAAVICSHTCVTGQSLH